MTRTYDFSLTRTDLEDALLHNQTAFIDNLLDAFGFDVDYDLSEEQFALASDLLSTAAALAYRESLPDEAGLMLVGRLADYTNLDRVYDLVMTSLNLSSYEYKEIPKDLRASIDAGDYDEEVAGLIPAMSLGEVLTTICYISDQVTAPPVGYAGPLLQKLYTILESSYLLSLLAATLILPELDDDCCEGEDCEYYEECEGCDGCTLEPFELGREDCAGCDGCFGEECENYADCDGCDNCEGFDPRGLA